MHFLHQNFGPIPFIFPKPAQFILIENRGLAQCRVSPDGFCIFSDEGGSTDNYPGDGDCTFQVSKRTSISSVRFRLGADDFLEIGTTQFTGFVGPSAFSVERGQDILFFADEDRFTVAGGFEICIDDP